MPPEHTEKSFKATILVVDDNPNNLNLLFDYLRESGFKTLFAENGEEAISQAKLAQPDIILLDVIMSGIDGFETCRQLKQNNNTRQIPVIFMTALYESVNKVRGFQVGGVDYITKPFQQEEVLARINKELIIQEQKSELLKLNENLTKVNQKLEESNATKNRFFSIIAHDMRDVFNGLLGFSEIIAKSGTNPDIEYLQIFAQHMHTSVQNAFHLLDNLLYWANIQMETMEYDPQRIDLYEIIPKSLREPEKFRKDVSLENNSRQTDSYGFIPQNMRLLEKIAGQKKISLENSISQKTFVYADSEMISTVICNLISNAIKFTQPGGSVQLMSEDKNEFVEVSIIDTGIGISKDNTNKLFKIEQKFKKNGTQGELGSGLGLILSRVLVEKNNGKIWVESVEKEGSRFIFSLPKNK